MPNIRSKETWMLLGFAVLALVELVGALVALGLGKL